MGEFTEPVAGDEHTTGTISHRRLLIEMMAITLLAGVIGLIAGSGRFFAGVLIGGAVSVINFLWLERSMRSIFLAGGESPVFLAIKYFLRYVLIGIVVIVVYLTGAVPVPSVILGLGSFGFAVVFEGITSIFRNP